jgi:two-component system, chemotaxis family, response regulator Rcp1
MKARDPSTPLEILLVDDNPGDVRLIEEILKESGMPIRLNVVRDGVEAMAFLRQEGPYAHVATPNLIVLDLNLPRKNGHEVIAEVKEDRGLKRIPVVVLTGSEAEEDINRAYDLHANCCIIKPFNLDQFIRVVRQMQDFWLNVAKFPGKRGTCEGKG